MNVVLAILLVVLIIEVWFVGSTLLEGLKAIGEIIESLSNLIRNTPSHR
jgi:hypothetical protein